jgi:hypothetical protein
MVLSGPKRVSAISSLTNKGCIFGSMAGMPPTIGVPSSIVGVYQKETSYCNFCLPPGCKDGFAYLKAKGLLSGNKGAGGVGRMQYMPGFNNLMGGVANYSGRGHVSSSSSQATPAPALTPTVVYNVYNDSSVGFENTTVQYTNGVGVSFMYYDENGSNVGSATISLSTNSNANNVQWSMSNNQYMSITSSGGTVNITGSTSNSGGTQALYFTIPQTTFNNVTYAAFSGSINVTANNTGSERT